MGQRDLPPGYRFSPTDEELVVHYLKNRACGKDFHQGIIAEVDIYKYEPWDLPEKSVLPSQDPVWYFFNAQDKRHSHTARINRTTGKGYWKATGKDRKICCGPHPAGIKKTLIYYEGRAPSGKRTDWIMHEYKLDEEFEKKSKVFCSIALCRIRKKGGPGPRNGEQYGASIFNENNELGEDVDEDVDEKLPIPSDSQCKASTSTIPNQIKEVKEEGDALLHNLQREGCASNQLSHSEGLDTNTEADLQAFLESVFPSDTEATSGQSDPEFLHTVFCKQPFVCGADADMYAVLDLQSFLDVDDKNMDDILHPTPGEEQILEELLHYAEGGLLHGSNDRECNGRIIPQPPACSDSTVAYNDAIVFGGDVGPSGVPGDFIELADMDSPLDSFIMQSPLHGRFYTAQDDPNLPFGPLNGVEYYGGSFDLLHTQGSAARRARLQIAPSSSVNMMHDKFQEQSDLHPKVQCGEKNIDKKLQKAGGKSSQNTILSSDLEEISNVVESLPKTFLSKHMSCCMVTKCEEALPQVFVTTTTEDEESAMNDSKSVTLADGALLSRPKNVRSLMQESISDCDDGLELRSVLISKQHQNVSSRIQDAGADCKAGLNPSRASEAKPSPSVTASPHGNSVIGELVSKVKSLTLGKGLAQLDSSLSTTFNDKVFALGKPVAHLVPSKDYVNPYSSLRRGAMASLFRLVIAVVFLFFVFLGIHMLTKYVLSVVART